MATATRTITVEEYQELPDAEGTQYELVRGQVVEMPGPNAVHNYIALIIARLVGAFVEEHDLGFTFGDHMSYILARDPDTVREPDASFISFARGGRTLPDGYWPLAPDLAVEVVSPSDRADDVQDKVHQYLAAGTQLVWVVWPRLRLVTVYTADDVRELREGDALDGGAVLPGFSAPVARLFPAT